MKNKLTFILSAILCLFSCISFGQTTLLGDNFEASYDWTIDGSTTINSWLVQNCVSNTGSFSAYVSSGGPINDCSPTGKYHYGYANALTGTPEVTRLIHTVDASCFTNMQISFDLQIQGEAGQDYFELVYSTNNGASWIPLTAQLSSVFPYANQVVTVPGALNNQAFLIGFQFTCNQTVVGAKPPSVDNFILQGTSSDTQAPSVLCPTIPVNTSFDNSCRYFMESVANLVTISDNCGMLNIVQTPVIGTLVTASTNVNFTVTDPSGFSTNCAFTLIPIDTTAPQLNCPINLNAYTNASCQAVLHDYSGLIQVLENCTPYTSLSYSFSPAIGSVHTADFMVTATVSDLVGNQSTCITNFILLDTVSPNITCPSTQQVPLSATCFALLPDFTTQATVVENCSSTGLSFTQTPNTSTFLGAGSYTVTLEVEDEAGNIGSCQFTAQLIDTTAPSITCPSNTFEATNTSCMAALASYSTFVSASDNCNPASLLSFSQSPAVGTLISVPTTVTIFISDTNNNSNSCVFIVTPIDTTGPLVSCLNDTLIQLSNPCNLIVPNLNGTHSAVDNCTPSNLLTFGQSPAAGTTISGPIQVIITYTDTTGNTGTCATQIIPIDVVAPTISCGAGPTLNNGTACTAALTDLTGLATVSDNCSQFTLTQSPAAGTILNAGTNSITLLATDLAGNQSSCITTFTIIESVSPNISCPNSTSTCNPIINYTTPVGNDNCAYVITQTDGTGFTNGDLFPIGITNQTYQISDSSGNTQSCTFTIEVFEYADTAKVTQDTIYLCSTFQTTVSAQAYQSGTGSWSVLTGSATITTPNALTTGVQNLNLGTNRILWTINSPTCSSKSDTIVIIVNTPAPQAALQDTIISCAQNGYIVQGSSPGTGQGTWSSNSAIGFVNIHSPITAMLNVPEGYNRIYWTVGSLGCTITTDSAIVYKPNVATIFTGDTSICTNSIPFGLNAKVPSTGESLIWNVISGNGKLSNKYSQNTALSEAGIGTVVVSYTLTHPGCGTTMDTTRITLIDCGGITINFPTMFTPNGDGKNDYFDIPNVNNAYPNCEVVIVNRWGAKVFESKGYDIPWDGTFNDEAVPMGTYFYSISSTDGSFERVTGPISILR